MGKLVMAVALLALSLPAAAQNYKMAETQVFCNIMGSYGAQAAADYYNRVPLETALRRTDAYVCTDQLRQVCDTKVGMLQDAIRTVYSVSEQGQTRNLPVDALPRLTDAIAVKETSMCWQTAKQQYGW